VALLASVVGLASSGRAKAQITIQSLLGKSISDPTAEQFPDVNDAIKRFTNRDPEAALKYLETAKRKNPKLPPAEMMLAQMWIAANQAGPARSALEDCVKNNPDDPEAYLVLGDLAFADRRYAESELLFAKSEQLAANFKDNLKRANDFRGRAEAGLASVAEIREQWDNAKKHLEAWLQVVDPTGAAPVPGSAPNTAAANAHDRLGRVIFRSDTDATKSAGARKAYEQFQQAVIDDNKSISADIALAQLYEDAKMHDKAKHFINYAVTRLPADQETKVATLIAAARWALDTNQAEDAYNYAKDAFNLDPKSKRALEAKFMMGVAARIKGDTKIAEQCLQDVVTASPANFPASNQLAQVLAEQKTDKEKQQRGLEIAGNNQAVAQANEGTRRDPGRAIEAASTLGWVLFMMNRIPEADQVTQAVINTGAATPDIWYYRARLFEEHGQTKEAIASLKASLTNKRGFFVHRDDAQHLLARLDKDNANADDKAGAADSSAGAASKSSDTPPSKAPDAKAPDTTADKGAK
jgi:tetratricopeptide (TPR) repeat protein